MAFEPDDSAAAKWGLEAREASDDEVDQQIIDAVVSEGKALLNELSQRGVSTEEVRVRAGQIGLTREFVRTCRLSGSRPAMRACMKCDEHFLSAGTHNRLCRRCAKA